MSTIAYGLGQGFASGADSVANAIATAERIKNNREQLRIQNQYAQLAQDKWGVQKQQEELAIREATMKLDAIENEMAADKAANFLVDGWEYGNYKQFQNFMLTDQRMKNIMKTLGYVNVEGLNDYTDSSIDTITGNPELAKQIRQNKNGYLVITDSQGNKKIVDTMLVGGMMGIQRRVNMARILRMQTQQERIAEQAETLGAKAKLAEAQKNPSLFGSQEALELRRTISPQGSLAQAKETIYDKKLAKDNADRESILKSNNIDDIDKGMSTYNKDNQFLASAQILSLALDKYKDDIMAGNSLKNAVEKGKDTKIMNAFRTYENLSGDTEKEFRKQLATDRDEWKVMQDTALGTLTGIKTGKDLIAALQKEETAAPIEKGINYAASKLGSDAAKALDQIESLQGKAAFLMLFNALLKDTSGQAVTDTEFQRKLGELGMPGETTIAQAISGLRNVVQSKLDYQVKLREGNPFAYALYQGDKKIKQYEFMLNKLDEKLVEYDKGGTTKQIKVIPKSPVAQQTQQPSAQAIQEADELEALIKSQQGGQ